MNRQTPRRMATTNVFKHKAGEYRSGLENLIRQQLEQTGVVYRYEPGRIEYKVAPRHYTPDFVLNNGIVIETKGFFVPKDRTKHIALKQQYPHLDLRFVFQNPGKRLSKTSKTTYAAWCEKNGFLYATKSIPQTWLDEEPCKERIRAVKELIK